MSQGVTRLIEATVKFRKLALSGSRKVSGQGAGNPEDNEVIRAFVGTYSPAVYAYYSSYASAAIREEKRSHTVFKSARVAIGIAAGLFAIGLMVWRPWSSLSANKPNHCRWINGCSNHHRRTSPTGSASLLNPLGVSPPHQRLRLSQATVANPRRRGNEQDRQGWRYLLDSGEILTAAQITGRYGLMVSEVYEDGSMRLIGEGVFYGPAGD